MKVPIFYYHSVGGPPPQTLDRRVFELHLQALQQAGFQTLTFAQLLRQRAGPATVVLTFDDGLLDNYEVVFPLLLEYGLVATFFCVPGYDGQTRWVHPRTQRWSDDPRPGYSQAFASVNAEQREEMARHGMEIASHTLTHRKLTTIPEVEWRRELCQSKEILEQQLGRPVETFCYPNGGYNSKVVRVVEEAGYLGACTTIPGYYSGRGNRFTIPRFLTEDPDFFPAVARGRAFCPRAVAGVAGKWLESRIRLWWTRLRYDLEQRLTCAQR